MVDMVPTETWRTNMTDTATVTVPNVLALTVNDIAKVYSGRPTRSGNHCRCGCCGKYSYNPSKFDVGSEVRGKGWPLEADDVSLRNVKRILKIVQGVAVAGGEVDVTDVYADVTVGDRSYTLYFV